VEPSDEFARFLRGARHNLGIALFLEERSPRGFTAPSSFPFRQKANGRPHPANDKSEKANDTNRHSFPDIRISGDFIASLQLDQWALSNFLISGYQDELLS
jgi:hypothetical protein